MKFIAESFNLEQITRNVYISSDFPVLDDQFSSRAAAGFSDIVDIVFVMYLYLHFVDVMYFQIFEVLLIFTFFKFSVLTCSVFEFFILSLFRCVWIFDFHVFHFQTFVSIIQIFSSPIFESCSLQFSAAVVVAYAFIIQFFSFGRVDKDPLCVRPHVLIITIVVSTLLFLLRARWRRHGLH